MSVADQISQRMPQVIDLRHRLHRIPEIGYEEFRTAETIRAELDRLGIPHTAGVADAPTATVAVLGDPSRPCVALRADIDALPIQEHTGLPYASNHPGFMHACGHDGHISTLLGAASILKQMDDLPVCVKLIWQPAEEGGGGASRLVDAGVLSGEVGPPVTAIFGLHGWPALKVGSVATRPGALLAATGNFDITFVGRGCHGAYPHLGRDPIVTACEAVLNLQQYASREFDPTDAVVVTVGVIAAGTAENVIPDTARIKGTVRTLDRSGYAAARDALERRCIGIADANDCSVRFEMEPGYPATINDPAMADYVARVARAALGADQFIPVARPSMGAEDFAYYLEKVPGCFFLIGVEPPDRNEYPPLHSDRFDFTDTAMAVGMRMFVELVRNYGRTPSGS
jgi:amidohydrolase